VVRKDFSARNAAVVSGFARTALDLMQSYRLGPAKFVADKVSSIAWFARRGESDGRGFAVAGNQYPNAAEQRALLTGTM